MDIVDADMVCLVLSLVQIGLQLLQKLCADSHSVVRYDDGENLILYPGADTDLQAVTVLTKTVLDGILHNGLQGHPRYGRIPATLLQVNAVS